MNHENPKYTSYQAQAKHGETTGKAKSSFQKSIKYQQPSDHEMAEEEKTPTLGASCRYVGNGNNRKQTLKKKVVSSLTL